MKILREASVAFLVSIFGLLASYGAGVFVESKPGLVLNRFAFELPNPYFGLQQAMRSSALAGDTLIGKEQYSKLDTTISEWFDNENIPNKNFAVVKLYELTNESNRVVDDIEIRVRSKFFGFLVDTSGRWRFIAPNADFRGFSFDPGESLSAIFLAEYGNDVLFFSARSLISAEEEVIPYEMISFLPSFFHSNAWILLSFILDGILLGFVTFFLMRRLILAGYLRQIYRNLQGDRKQP